MDPWVNSLVQSPLVRSLNTVPSRMSSFAHGVRDNVPPFSFSKVEVKPQTPASAGWDDSPCTISSTTNYEFKIPQYGLLDRAYLKVRIRRKFTAGSVLAELDAGETLVQKTISSAWNFAEIVESVSLKTTRGDFLTMPAAGIASEVQKMSSAARKYWMKGMAGYAAGKFATADLGTPSDHPFLIPFDQSAAVSTYQNQMNIADFLIPLPFDVLSQLKDNFQTRFVEDLIVNVSFKPYAGYHAVGLANGNDSLNASLVCLYHNFHDVIENSIRDQNYKRGFPASIYTHSYKTAGGSPIYSNSDKRLTIPITQNQLCNEFILVLRSTTAAASVYNVGSHSTSPVSKVGNVIVTLVGSGRELWKGTWAELACADVQDYELADGHPWGEDSSLSLVGNDDVALAAPLNLTDLSRVLPVKGGILYSFARNMRVLRFGFQSNAHYYTGGLALQTISNPQLILDAPTSWLTAAMTCDVVMKHSMLMRIDSDTGVITTALDV